MINNSEENNVFAFFKKFSLAFCAVLMLVFIGLTLYYEGVLLFNFFGIVSLIAAMFSLIFLIFLIMSAKNFYADMINIKPVASILIALFTTILPRVIWISLIDITPISDFYRYQSIASSIANGTGIPAPDFIAVFPHNMGYPFFLSFFYKVFGVSVLTSQILNILLCSIIAVEIYFIVKKIFNEKRAFIASLFWALFPSQIISVSFVCTEILHLSLLLGAVLLYFKIKDIEKFKVRLPLWILLALVIIISNSVRPLGIILFIAFLLYDIFFIPRKKNKILCYAAFVLSFFLLLQGLYFIQSKTVGQPISKSFAGWNLFNGMNPDQNNIWSEGGDTVLLSKIINDKTLTAPEKQKYFTDKGIERLKNNIATGKLLPLLIEKHNKLWLDDSAFYHWAKEYQLKESSVIDLEKNKGNVFQVISTLYYFLIMSLCIFPIIKIMRERKETGEILILIISFGLILVPLITEANARYHYPVNSLLCIIAAGAFSSDFLNIPNFLNILNIVKKHKK